MSENPTAGDLQRIAEAVRSLQTRHTYFLLGAAASGIALAVSQTMDAVPEPRLLILAAAVASWAASFVTGCRYATGSVGLLLLNADVLKARHGKSAANELPGSERMPPALVSDVLAEGYEEENAKVAKRGDWQFTLLVVGAVVYLIWHIANILSRVEST